MTRGIDKNIFGNYLRQTRKSCNLTQEDVYRLTHITPETLRRLENGYSLPQIRTMEELSVAYKVDILNSFMRLRTSNKYYSLYQMVVDLIIDFDINQLSKVRSLYLEYAQDDQSEMFDLTELKQFDLILIVIESMYNETSYKVKTERRIFELIRINHPSFCLSNLDTFNFTVLELKALLLLSKIYSEIARNYASNIILHYLNAQCIYKSNEYDSLRQLKKTQIKILFNISYNYHCLDEHHKVIEYCKIGIEKCRKEKNFYYLHGLYYRLGIAHLLLGRDENQCIDYLKKAFMLLEIENKESLIEEYRRVTLDKYGIKM